MTITISNLRVADNAPAGTIIGMLTATNAPGTVIPCNFMLTKKSAGYFAISGANLITQWTGSIAPGYYSVRVRANGINSRFSGSATFTITVGAADGTPPTPTGIVFIPANASLPDNSVAGTTVATVSVSMSDGSAFSGTLVAAPPTIVAVAGGTRLVLARALTAADDGPHQWSVAGTQNGVTVSGSIPVQINATPIGVKFTPTAASLPDNAAAGSTVAAVSV
jgi:hypothetical protein